MKRGFTLFLLALFLLNVLGYYGVLVGLQIKNAQNLSAQFDEDDYAREHEVTIKVPLTIPYGTDAKEYTRVDGEFEHQGEFYRLVKQRFQKDTLYIVCVKDNTSRNIKRALTDYVKTFTDKPVSEKNNSQTIKNPVKDYIVSFTTLLSSSDGWHHDLNIGEPVIQYELLFAQVKSPPPKV